MSETKSIQSGPVTRGQIEAMNTIPLGKSIVDKDGLKRTVIERTSKFFKIQRGTNAGAANFQNLNEKVSIFLALVKKNLILFYVVLS